MAWRKSRNKAGKSFIAERDVDQLAIVVGDDSADSRGVPQVVRNNSLGKRGRSTTLTLYTDNRLVSAISQAIVSYRENLKQTELDDKGSKVMAARTRNPRSDKIIAGKNASHRQRIIDIRDLGGEMLMKHIKEYFRNNG